MYGSASTRSEVHDFRSLESRLGRASRETPADAYTSVVPTPRCMYSREDFSLLARHDIFILGTHIYVLHECCLFHFRINLALGFGLDPL